MIILISFVLLLIIFFYLPFHKEEFNQFNQNIQTLIIQEKYGRLGNNFIQLINILKQANQEKVFIDISELYQTDLNLIINLPKLKNDFNNKIKKEVVNQEVLNREVLNKEVLNKEVVNDIFFRELSLQEMKNISDEFVINYLRSDFNVRRSGKLLIHIRSGDIFNKTLHQDYTQPPLKFYLMIINEYLKNHSIEDIILLSEPKMEFDNPVIDELLKIYPGIILKRPDIVDSVKLILSSEEVVSSNSTMILTMLCLSKHIKKIIVSNYNNKFIKIDNLGEKGVIEGYFINDYITSWEQSSENLKTMINYDGLIEKNKQKNKEKNAIVVLTRNYSNNEDYSLLIKRNNSIEKFIQDPIDSFDNIIYHEGITTEQQKFIQSKTNLKLIFKKINFKKIISGKNKYCHETDLSRKFDEGYKNMCKFWTIDFLEHLHDYNLIMRLDEDCELKNKVLINDLSKNVYRTGMFQDFDLKDVTIGLIDFTNDFLKKNKNKDFIIKEDIKCPYTNFFIMNVNYFHKNKIIMKYLKEVEKTNCIFINRWGDLPIYGIILNLFVPKYLVKTDSSLKYYHDSHSQLVN